MRTPRSVRRARYKRAVRPPMRGGINATDMMLEPGPWATMGQWIAYRFGDEGIAACERGDFFYDAAVPVTADDFYRGGQRIWVFRPVPDEPDQPITLPVVYENERFVVVDKPHGMATIPRGSHVAQTVTVAARRQFSNDELVSAHRLDMETAGLVMLTKAPQWRGAYQHMFAKQTVGKKYAAVAPVVAGFTDWRRVELRLERGRVPLRTDVVDGEPNAITDMRIERILDRMDDAGRALALWEMVPLTGKTHQLRVTLEHLGSPIVGDPLYPRLLTFDEMDEREFPLQLLAKELSFVDPVDGEDRVFRSSLELDATRGVS
ncbi:MAG: pseudouridylate synthase [Actinomycetaceae bacterium]|nr:pseudouridylate synthase [Actinomycetaceae bacterium]